MLVDYLLNRGREQGIEQGILQGIEKGILQGIERGIEMTKFEVVSKLYAKGFDWESISELTGITQEKFEAYIARHQKS